MKKIICFMIINLIFLNPASAQSFTEGASEVLNHVFYVQKYKNYICIHRRNRAVIYNALNLSDEQILLRENIAQKYEPIYDEKFKILLKEAQKLDAYKLTGQNFCLNYKQKRIIRKVQLEIADLYEAENREFRQCLTKEQCKNYKQIKKLEYEDFKNCHKRKNYYKSNPKMKSFGNPKPCPTSIGNAE